MKAKITPDGKLAVSPETDTEEYAIQKWIDEEIDLGEGRLPNVMIDKPYVPTVTGPNVGAMSRCTCGSSTAAICPVHNPFPNASVTAVASAESNLISDWEVPQKFWADLRSPPQ